MWAEANLHYLSNLSIVAELLLKLGTPWKIGIASLNCCAAILFDLQTKNILDTRFAKN